MYFMDKSLTKFWTRFPKETGNLKTVHCGVKKKR